MRSKIINAVKWIMVIPLALCMIIEASAAQYQWTGAAVMAGSTYYGLQPTEHYTYFLVGDSQKGITESGNLLHIDQQEASVNGHVSFVYPGGQYTAGTPLLRGQNCALAQELTWILESNGTLIIGGQAPIRALPDSTMPWSSVEDQVAAVWMDASVSQVGSNSFAGCSGLKSIEFTGDAPVFLADCFSGVNAVAFYPRNNETWENSVFQNYGGSIQWLAGPAFIPVQSVTISETAVEMNVLEQHQLAVSVMPENAQYKDISWYCTDTTVATVDEQGNVLAVGKGTADVIAVTTDGTEISAKCTVTVKNSVYHVQDVSDMCSPHPYPSNASDIWIYTLDNADSLMVCFDEQTELEDGQDYLLVFNGEDEEVGRYTGQSLSGKTIEISGDTVKLQLLTDAVGTAWGFGVTEIRLNHVHQYQETIIPPTCVEDGYTTFSCACGDSYIDEYTNALGHSYDMWETVVAFTCTTDGQERRDCQNCNHYEERLVVAAHRSESIPEKAATCIETGLTEGMRCSACEEILTEQQEVPALGHQHIVDAAIEESCITSGLTVGSHCGRCHEILVVQEMKPALGHQWDNGIVIAEPAAKYSGIRVYACERCEESKTEVIPALEHIHEYSTATMAPTCTNQGYTTYTCTCGESYIDDYVDALGHREIADIGKMASCTEAGLSDGSHCSVCGQSVLAQVELPALGHQWDGGTVIIEPTEDATGRMLHNCDRCGEEWEEEIPEADHIHNYETVETAPSCTEQGYTTYICSCGDSYEGDFKEAVGHNVVTDAAVISACNIAGLSEGSHCSSCGTVLVSQIIQPALGHQWNEGEETVAPTEYSDGIITYGCHRCDEKKTGRIPALRHIHNYTAEETEATCTRQGYTTYICVCGDSYVDELVDALKHQWDEGIVTREPTEKTPGVRRHSCERCSEEKEEAIPLLEHIHSYNAVITDPGCTEQGYTTHTCACGDSYVDDYVDATGHNYQNGVCTNCGKVNDEIVEYTYGQNVQIKLIEPWGIRANAKISTSAGVVDYDSLYDYGVYFIRKSALDRTGLTQSTITVADILNDTDARKMTKADGVTVSSGYLSAIYDSDIYTYELDDSVFVMFYFITEEGADPIYVPVRERNLKTLAQQRMNDAASFPNDLERDVYKKMVTLEADVTDYRSDFTSLSTPEMQKAPTLAQYPLGAAAANSSYTYGQNAQIKLIEPWGLKANVKVSLNGRVIDYSTVEEYGMVVLADNSKVYNDASEILQNENAYVFSSKNGDATISNGYISATYSKDIFTYQLDTDIYVFGYVKDADGYHYGPVRNRNVYDLMMDRKDDAANFPNVKERTVYTDMIDLHDAITAYREDYFKN